MPGMKNISFGGLNLISGDSQINCRSLLTCEHVFLWTKKIVMYKNPHSKIVHSKMNFPSK